MRGTRRLRTCAAALAMAILAGCADGTWRTHDVTHFVPDLAFRLTDDRGRAVNAEDYRGRVVLLYFGYTHCPDVCPATLAQMSAILDSLGSGSRDARVLFVTVDPARDTTQMMHEYAQAFGDRLIGLRGDADALDALTRRYRVTYSHGEPDAQGRYDVTHSTAVFVFDGQGDARLVFTAKDEPEAMAADLRRLLQQPG